MSEFTPSQRTLPGAARGLRLNVGAGTSVVEGYINVDSSPTLLVSKLLPEPLVFLLARILPGERAAVLRSYRAVASRMVYADARRRLPFGDSTVEIVYSSHFLEHIRRQDASRFVTQCHRVLRPGGLLRLAVPDLRKLAVAYVGREAGRGVDADRFLEALMLNSPARQPLLRRVLDAVLDRHEHLWMYDAPSLVSLCRQAGFGEPRECRYLESQIPEVRELDVPHRAEESTYVEALR